MLKQILGAWLLVLMLCVRAQAAEFKTYTLADGAYSVLLPGRPTGTKTAHKESFGTMTEYDASLELKPVSYILNCQVYPEKAMKLVQKNELLKEARDAMVQGDEKNVLSQTHISYKGNEAAPGFEIKMKVADEGALATLRLYVIGNKVLTIAAVSDAEKPAADEINKFFASLDVK